MPPARSNADTKTPRHGDAGTRRLQICVLASLAAHLGLLFFLHESYLRCGVPSSTFTRRTPDERRVVLDFHSLRNPRPDARQSFETPVETKPPREKPLEEWKRRASSPEVPERPRAAPERPREYLPEALPAKPRREESRRMAPARPLERQPVRPEPLPDERIVPARAGRPEQDLRSESGVVAASRSAAKPPAPARGASPPAPARARAAPASLASRGAGPRRAPTEPPRLDSSSPAAVARPAIILPGDAQTERIQPASGGAGPRRIADLPDAPREDASRQAPASAPGNPGRLAEFPSSAWTLGLNNYVPSVAPIRGEQEQHNARPASGVIGRAALSAGLPADAAAADNPLEPAPQAGESGGRGLSDLGESDEPRAAHAGDGTKSGQGVAELARRGAPGAALGGGSRLSPLENRFLQVGDGGDGRTTGLPSRGRTTSDGPVVLGGGPAGAAIRRSGLGRGLDIDAAISEPTEAYQHRAPGSRGRDLKTAGGDEGTEAAVERGLDFLARVQFPDGHWSLDRLPPGVALPDAALGEMQADAAATGLALLTYLGGGYTHLDARRQDTVRRGIEWLVRGQKPDGDLFRGGSPFTHFYSHGIATMALCEAYGMTQDPELRGPAERAVAFIVRTQHPTLGGWRYAIQTGSGHSTETDTSVTGWQLMALKSAEMAGLAVPAGAFQKVDAWLDFARAPAGVGLYVYNPNAAATAEQRHGREPSLAMTAEAMLMRQYLGCPRGDPALVAGAEYLRANLPAMGTTAQSARDCYYWYYATQAMFQMRGDFWTQWNNRMRPLAQNSQETSGAAAGSWHPHRPTRDRWGAAGGRIYTTALHLLILEVYYRHLPLFRME